MVHSSVDYVLGVPSENIRLVSKVSPNTFSTIHSKFHATYVRQELELWYTNETFQRHKTGMQVRSSVSRQAVPHFIFSKESFSVPCPEGNFDASQAEPPEAVRVILVFIIILCVIHYHAPSVLH